ncbi:hypothetical protein TIFTF001_050232 [Ficus carica]|uniref:Uncharacterized protein n=1 Tax=Ficus carica TaxID=3494 RepID=A0AA88CN03_FICCA|nr:hypothetical protein TIFTF001_050232 [Ficus carica]
MFGLIPRDRCPKVTSSNLIGYHASRGHITRASNLLLQFVGATNPSASITWLVHGNELDRAGRPNHSMAARHVGLAERKLTTYVYAVAAYVRRVVTELVSEPGFLPSGFTVCLPAPQSLFVTMDDDRDAALVFFGMQPLLGASPGFISHSVSSVEARVWWMTVGEPAMPGGTWADFRILTTARYGPPPDEDAIMPARDPEIYNDMYLSRFLSYVADWSAYLNESMGHYCRRFQEAMLPHIPPAIGDPLLQALFLIREGLPPHVRAFVPEPIAGMTLEGMIEIIMEAEIIVQGIQAAAPEEDQVVPVHDADIEEAGAENDVMDPADIPEDHLEDPPVIIVASDDEEEDFDDLEEPEEDPEEILFDHADWDADSDVSSDR